jgi:hypothetical protein
MANNLVRLSFYRIYRENSMILQHHTNLAQLNLDIDL